MELIKPSTHTVARIDVGVTAAGLRACRLGDLRALLEHVEGLPDGASVFVRAADGSTVDFRHIEVST